MPKWISSASEAVVLRRVVLGWVILFSINSLITCIIAALYNQKWKLLDTQDQVMIILLILANWTTVMMAFANKAVARMQQGKLPFSEDDTQIIKRNQVAISTTTEVKPGP